MRPPPKSDKPSRLSAALIRPWVPKRSLDSSKQDHGHVLLIAGHSGMSGAAYLAGLAALRAGAGLVTIASPASIQPVIASQLPEALTLALEEDEGGVSHRNVPTLLEYASQRRVTAIVVGPGLGVSDPIRVFLKTFLRFLEIPVVVDADALNNLTLADFKPTFILTPHEGEMARLLQQDRERVHHHRVESVLRAHRESKAICVLKGAATLIAGEGHLWENPTGNSALASAGMGDVLSGVIGTFAGQVESLVQAAALGVFLHGVSADLTTISDRGLLAREVADGLPSAFQNLGVRPHGRIARRSR